MIQEKTKQSVLAAAAIHVSVTHISSSFWIFFLFNYRLLSCVGMAYRASRRYCKVIYTQIDWKKISGNRSREEKPKKKKNCLNINFNSNWYEIDVDKLQAKWTGEIQNWILGINECYKCVNFISCSLRPKRGHKQVGKRKWIKLNTRGLLQRVRWQIRTQL